MAPADILVTEHGEEIKILLAKMDSTGPKGLIQILLCVSIMEGQNCSSFGGIVSHPAA
jgi:hypothetical protein